MWLEIGTAILIFISLIFFSLLPYCGLSLGARSKNGALLLSLCNCVACGIFLSTCFLGLVPHVTMQERSIRKSWTTGADNSSTPLTSTSDFLLNTQLIILSGFVLILIIEQCIFACSGGHGHSHGGNGTGHSHLHNEDDDEMRMTRVGGRREDAAEPLVDAFDDEDDEMEEIVFRKESADIASPGHHVGHGHGGHSHAVSLSSGLSLRTAFLLLGLSIHSLFEGLALGLQSDHGDFVKLLVAIMLHEVLCCVAYGVSLAQQRAPAGAAVASVLVLSACIPVGMMIAVVVTLVEGSSAALLRFVLEGLAAGTFVYVACVEMLAVELNQMHGKNGVAASFAVAGGVLLFAAIQAAAHDH